MKKYKIIFALILLMFLFVNISNISANEINNNNSINIPSNDINSVGDFNTVLNSSFNEKYSGSVGDFNTVLNSSFNEKYSGSVGDYNNISSITSSGMSGSAHLNSSNMSVYPNSADNFTVKFTNSNNMPLSGYEISLNLSNSIGDYKIYYSTTNTEGIAKLPINLVQPGVYTIISSFEGDNYTSFDDSKITVLPKLATNSFQGNDLTVPPSSSENFTVKLIDTYNDFPLVDYKVKFRLFNSLGEYNDYYSNTNSEGRANLLINLNYECIYRVIAIFEGNNKYNALNSSEYYIYVKKLGSTISIYNNSVKSQNYWNFCLKDSREKGIPNQKVNIILNNQNYEVTTNTEGLGSLKIDLNPNKYDIFLNYNGSKQYYDSKTNENLFVFNNSINTAITINSKSVGKKENIYFTLWDLYYSKTIPYQNINIMASSSHISKNYTLLTNEGVASLKASDIGVGKWNLTVSYLGNDKYEKTNINTQIGF